MSGPLYTCDRLEIGYGRAPLLPPISLSVGRGEFWAVVGRNGSGKTTWFRTLLGLQPPVGGAVIHPGGPPRATYIPQRQGYDPIYPLTAAQVVAMAVDRGWSFTRPRAGGDAVRAALAEVGAAELASRTFRSLSEGQKQRVLLARLVAAEADVAFLDEPTAAMDRVAEREALALLDRVRAPRDDHRGGQPRPRGRPRVRRPLPLPRPRHPAPRGGHPRRGLPAPGLPGALRHRGGRRCLRR